MSTTKTTLVTQFKLRKDAKQQFAAWQEKMNKAASNFAGFASLEMRPQELDEYTLWRSVQRFNSNQDLEKWRQSEERAALLKEVAPLLVKNEPIQEIDEGIKSVTEVFVTVHHLLRG